jgi:lipopolysaccharide export system protein LptA
MKSNIILISIALLFSSLSFAGPDDFKKEIQVGSDRQFGSIKDKVMTFVDNVKVEQGSLLIEADKLEVIASAGKGKEVFIASGKPATYSQLLDGDKPIKASANEIRYDVANGTLVLTGNAELSQNGSMVQGALIKYNLEKQELEAESNGKKTERVTTVFSPEGKQ